MRPRVVRSSFNALRASRGLPRHTPWRPWRSRG